MSCTEYLRYPDGVRSGSTRPSFSRCRIFDSLMSASGNSALRSATAWPIVIRPTVACATSAGLLVAGEEDQPELADAHLVTVLQGSIVNPVAVDVGAVEAA